MSRKIEKINCECGAKVPNTSKYRKRFLRRHPSLCRAHQNKLSFNKSLAEGTRSVEGQDLTEAIQEVLK